MPTNAPATQCSQAADRACHVRSQHGIRVTDERVAVAQVLPALLVLVQNPLNAQATLSALAPSMGMASSGSLWERLARVWALLEPAAQQVMVGCFVVVVGKFREGFVPHVLNG
jgi:hypothetical protein